MINQLYQKFLQVNADEIHESLELIANSQPNTEIQIPSLFVGEVITWSLGYGSFRMNFDNVARVKKNKKFDKFYEKLKTTSFWKDILNKGSECCLDEDFLKSDLYGHFLSRFSRHIYKTIELLDKKLSSVDFDFAVIDVLQKMGYARMLTYHPHGEDLYEKTEAFDEFYSCLKETKFYEDVRRNAELKF